LQSKLSKVAEELESEKMLNASMSEKNASVGEKFKLFQDKVKIKLAAMTEKQCETNTKNEQLENELKQLREEKAEHILNLSTQLENSKLDNVTLSNQLLQENERSAALNVQLKELMQSHKASIKSSEATKLSLAENQESHRTLKQQYSKQSKDMAELNRKLAEFQSQLAASESTRKNLETQVENTKKDIEKQVENSKKDLDKQIENAKKECQAQLAASENTRKNLEKQVEISKKDKSTLEASASQMSENNKTLKKQINVLKTKLEEKETESKADVMKINDELLRVNTFNENLESKYQTSSHKIKALEVSQDKLKSQISELKTIICGKDEQLKIAKTEFESLTKSHQSQVQQLNGELASIEEERVVLLQNSLSTLQQEVLKHLSLIEIGFELKQATLSDRLDSAIKRCEELSMSLLETQKNRDALEMTCESQIVIIDSLECRVKKYEGEVLDYQKQTLELNGDIEAARASVTALESKYAECSQNLQKASTKFKSLKKENSVINHENEKMQAEINEKSEVISNLDVQIEKSADKIKQLNDKIHDLTKSVSCLGFEKETVKAMNNRYSTMIGQLKGKYDKHEAEVEACISSYQNQITLLQEESLFREGSIQRTQGIVELSSSFINMIATKLDLRPQTQMTEYPMLDRWQSLYGVIGAKIEQLMGGTAHYDDQISALTETTEAQRKDMQIQIKKLNLLKARYDSLSAKSDMQLKYIGELQCMVEHWRPIQCIDKPPAHLKELDKILSLIDSLKPKVSITEQQSHATLHLEKKDSEIVHDKKNWKIVSSYVKKQKSDKWMGVLSLKAGGSFQDWKESVTEMNDMQKALKDLVTEYGILSKKYESCVRELESIKSSRVNNPKFVQSLVFQTLNVQATLLGLESFLGIEPAGSLKSRVEAVDSAIRKTVVDRNERISQLQVSLGRISLYYEEYVYTLDSQLASRDFSMMSQ
jgi:chromosome segregation ATPase